MTTKNSVLTLQVPVPQAEPRGAAAASELIYGLFRAIQFAGAGTLWTLRVIGVSSERSHLRSVLLHKDQSGTALVFESAETETALQSRMSERCNIGVD